MRALLSLVIGVLIGAAGFHLYYLRLDGAARCGWDHPLDDGAQAACREAIGRHGYASEARRALDDLIGNVAR